MDPVVRRCDRPHGPSHARRTPKVIGASQLAGQHDIDSPLWICAPPRPRTARMTSVEYVRWVRWIPYSIPIHECGLRSSCTWYGGKAFTLSERSA